MRTPAHGEGRYQGGAGEEYFAWQSEIGRLGGRLNLWKFEAMMTPALTVADFGCGGGFLLSNLQCGRKIGIELNPAARRHAASLGLETYATLDEVPEASVDLMISNHALEHVRAPFDILVAARRVIKPGATLAFVVPYDGWMRPGTFVRDDINQHLYAWTPQLLGNLVQAAGFEVEVCEVLWSAWTPAAFKWWGWNPLLYRIACFVMAIKHAAPQLRVVARRPVAG